MAFARTTTHTKTLLVPSTGTEDKVYGADYVSATSHSAALSGADVGGIPYCPTATTEVTSSGFTFNASGAAGEGLAIGAGIATTNVNALNIAQTWSAAGVTFTGIKFNATNTASGSSSRLIDLQFGGVSVLYATKIGIQVINTTGGGGDIVSSDSSGNTIYALGGNYSGLHLVSNGLVGWTSGTTNGGAAPDSNISRISAGVLGIGTGANGSVAGTISAAAYISGGSAGVDFGPGPVTSITIKKGIVTACS